MGILTWFWGEDKAPEKAIVYMLASKGWMAVTEDLAKTGLPAQYFEDRLSDVQGKCQTVECFQDETAAKKAQNYRYGVAVFELQVPKSACSKPDSDGKIKVNISRLPLDSILRAHLWDPVLVKNRLLENPAHAAAASVATSEADSPDSQTNHKDLTP